MTGLHVGLIVLSVVLVVVVFLINKYQIYRYRWRFSAVRRQDGLQPNRYSHFVCEQSVAYERSLLCQKKDTPTQGDIPTQGHSMVSNEGWDMLNAKVDDLVWLTLDRSILPEQYCDLVDHLRKISPAVHVLGWNTQSKVWSCVDQIHQPVRKICCGIQMVSRGGLTPQDVLMAVRQLCQDLVAHCRGQCVMDDWQEVLQRAQVLDHFVNEVDVELSLTVLAEKDPFPGTKLRALAEASGCRLGGDGRYHRVTVDGGQDVFVLTNLDGHHFDPESMRIQSYHTLCLFIDVPRVAEPIEAFNQIVTFSRRLAHSLGGQIVDDLRRPLNDHSIEVIRKLLIVLVQKMHDFSVVPGSALALRLFGSLEDLSHR